MIIARSPLRISICGGGTDLPFYYREFGGSLVSAAIDKYIYVTVIEPFFPGVFLKYSEIEHVENFDSINHNIMRETLKYFYGENAKQPRIEITTLADVPAGTGLGSSGSFTCCLIQALSEFTNTFLERQSLAELACKMEIEKLGCPVGKQDQYIATYGGIRSFQFNPDDSVNINSLKISKNKMHELEDNLLLFFTDKTRSASEVLGESTSEKNGTQIYPKKAIDNLHEIKRLGDIMKHALEEGDLDSYGQLLHEHWICKRQRSQSISTTKIDELYQLGIENGAIGGKLVGAGGGGFLLFYAKDPKQLRKAMKNVGVEELRFNFDISGVRIVEI